jgi:hypothetical protein
MILGKQVVAVVEIVFLELLHAELREEFVFGLPDQA